MTTTRLTPNPARTGLMNGKKNCLPLLVFGMLVLALALAMPAAAASPPGSVTVWSDVTPALVCIDGDFCHGTFDDGTAYFSDLTLNSYHVVTVTADGYKPNTQSFYASSSASGITITADLDPVTQDTGFVVVGVNPYGGTVCMDGWDCEYHGAPDYSARSSQQFDNLAANKYHTLTVDVNGFQPYTKRVWVSPGYNSLEVYMQSW
jgi:hypothetical protein